jgi:ferric-dicitrate binding protein FerR (iron transport regulator)
MDSDDEPAPSPPKRPHKRPRYALNLNSTDVERELEEAQEKLYARDRELDAEKAKVKSLREELERANSNLQAAKEAKAAPGQVRTAAHPAGHEHALAPAKGDFDILAQLGGTRVLPWG